jgi:hypothetical protein
MSKKTKRENSTTSLLTGSGFIAYRSSIAHSINISTALVLGELCNAYERWGHKEFYMQQNRICDATALGKKTIQRSIKKLVDLGIVMIRRRGCPAMNYYRIDEQILKQFIADADATKSPIKSGQIDCSFIYNKEKDLKENKNKKNLNKKNEEPPISPPEGDVYVFDSSFIGNGRSMENIPLPNEDHVSVKIHCTKSEQTSRKSHQIDFGTDSTVLSTHNTKNDTDAAPAQSDAISFERPKLRPRLLRENNITEEHLQLLDRAFTEVSFSKPAYKNFWSLSFLIYKKLDFYVLDSTGNYLDSKDISDINVWRFSISIADFLLRGIRRCNKAAYCSRDIVELYYEWAIQVHPYLKSEGKEGCRFYSLLRAIVFIFAYDEDSEFRWSSVITSMRLFLKHLEAIMGKCRDRYNDVKQELEYEKMCKEMKTQEERRKEQFKQRIYKAREMQIHYRPEQLKQLNIRRFGMIPLTECDNWRYEDREWEKIVADIDYWCSNENLCKTAISMFT